MKLDLKVIALVCVFLGGMGQGVVAPQIPTLLQGAEGLAMSSGISATLLYLGIFFSSFWYGKLADRGKVSQLLSGGLFFYAITLFLFTQSPGLIQIFILRFVEGLSVCAVYIAADYILGKLSPKESRGQWLSFYGIALSVGLLFGPLLTLLFEHFNYPSVFSIEILAGVVLLAAVVILLIRPEIASVSPEGRPELNRGALALAKVYGFIESALVALFPVIALQFFHLKPEICLVAVIVSAAVLSYPFGVLIDRFTPEKVAIGIFLIMTGFATVFFVLSRDVASLFLVYGSCAFFGLIAAGLYPAGFTWLLRDISIEDYGYASGSFSRSYAIGSLFGPFIAGFAVGQTGAPGFYFILVILGLLGLIMMKRHGKRSSPH